MSRQRRCEFSKFFTVFSIVDHTDLCTSHIERVLKSFIVVL